jgi:hypothetical protein
VDQRGKSHILPAEFNDTPVPGMTTTVGFVDLRNTNPGDFVQMVLARLGRANWTGQTLVNHTVDCRIPSFSMRPTMN